MIIFYNKQTGDITGTINGRVHPPAEKNMWVGSQADTARIIVEWKPTGEEYEAEINTEVYVKVGVNESGQEILSRQVVPKKIKRRENEPQSDQKELFKSFDKNSMEVYKYKVDIKTERLVLK